MHPGGGGALRTPALIALNKEVMGGLQKLWWANFRLLILVVRAYEKPAVSTMGIHWERFKLGPNRCWVFLVALPFVRILIETPEWSLQPRCG